MVSRRNFLLGLGATGILAPAIIRDYTRLMPVKVIESESETIFSAMMNQRGVYCWIAIPDAEIRFATGRILAIYMTGADINAQT